MKFVLLAFSLLALSVSLRAQGSPEEKAIAEILLAKDLADVERHLPVALRTALATMDKAGREQLLSRPLATMREKSLKVSPGRNGQALVEFDVDLPEAEIKHFELRTERRISDGAEAVLVLALVAPEKRWGGAEIWMKLEDGAWRVREFRDPSGYGGVDLEDPETIAELVQAPMRMNEGSAIGSLRELATALVSYSAGFSEMPDSMDALGGPAEAESSKDHALLIDSQLASTHVQSGYRFEYQKTSIDSYRITARPLDFGKSGRRNFFVDESGVIRFTEEDREATTNDDVLGGRQFRGRSY